MHRVRISCIGFTKPYIWCSHREVIYVICMNKAQNKHRSPESRCGSALLRLEQYPLLSPEMCVIYYLIDITLISLPHCGSTLP